MRPKIDASTLLTRRYLKLRKNGVYFYGNSFWGGNSFRFDQIDCVLLSPTHELSFQVGNEVFSIQTKPNKPRHQAAIAALLEGLGAKPPPASL
jgi:hypothetical protein